MIRELFRKLEGDRVLWMVTILLAILSLLAVYSSVSSLAYSNQANSFKYLFKHGAMLCMGMLVIYGVHLLKVRYFYRLSTIMIWVAGILLLLTLLFGSNINDASRWLRIPGIGISFQTSDFAKIALVIYVARMLAEKRTILHDFKNGVVPILIPIGIICALILPADFSTAAMLFLVSLLLLFIGGVPFKHLIKIIGAGFAAIFLIYLVGKAAPDIFPRFDTWVQRIENFSNPSDAGNYQVQLSQIAIYNGGLLPQGPGSGSSRNYLPHPYSDMIYAFIIEEYGSVIGGMGLILLYLILLYRSIRLSLKSPKHFGGLMAIGLSILLVSQAMINMAVAVNLFPTTGQTLPLVSLGGTSTILTCLAIGLIQSVARTVYNPDKVLKGEGNRVVNPVQQKSYAGS